VPEWKANNTFITWVWNSTSSDELLNKTGKTEGGVGTYANTRASKAAPVMSTDLLRVCNAAKGACMYTRKLKKSN